MAQRFNIPSGNVRNKTRRQLTSRFKRRGGCATFELLETRQMMSTAVLMAANTTTAKINHFTAHITSEVESHLTHGNGTKFQDHIASEQNRFAASIAKAGGTYTPIDFTTLVGDAAAAKAAALAAKINKETSAFTVHLVKEIHSHPTKLTTSKFQDHITAEQDTFAAKVARQGGTYTVVPYNSLVIEAGEPPVFGTSATIPTLAYTVPSSSEIDLTWNAITGALGYTLEKSVNAGTTWTTIASPSGTSYNNFGLTTDTSYQFRISTITSTGTVGPSTVLTVSTRLLPPTHFAARATGATTVALTWTAVTHATAYLVERSLDGNTWATLTAANSLAGTASSFSDATALAGTNYFYRISAIDTVGTSVPSSPISVTTVPAQPVVTGVAISSSQMNLSWGAVASAFSYKLETSLNSTKWSTLATLSTNSFTQTGLTADSSHYYRLTAISGAGASQVSAVINDKTLLGAPAGLRAIAASTSSMTVSWVASTDSTGYTLQRSTDNATWGTIQASTGFTHTTTSFSDTNLSSGTLYYYRLSAKSAAGTSVYDASVNAATLTLAPTVAGTVISSSSVLISWPAITGATGYKVEGSVNNGVTWTTLAANQTAVNYSQGSLLANSVHKYRVTTLSSTGKSVLSNIVALTTYTVAPAALHVAAASATTIQTSWVDVGGATGYKLERSLNNTTWATLNASTGFTSSTASYLDTGLVGGTLYYYRLSTVESAITTNPTAVQSALTYPAQPVVTAAPISASAVNVSWGAITSASSYIVEVSSNGGSSWSSSTQSGITFAATGLAPDAVYNFRITAVNTTGNSVASTIVNSTTLLNTPTNFSATSPTATDVHLIWSPVTDATNYKLERLTNGTWSTLTTAFNASSVSFDDTTALAGTAYQYRLSAIDASGTSLAASPVSILTLPGKTNVSGSVISSTTLGVTWTTVPSANNYLLETSTDGTNWSTITTQTGLTYNASGRNADTSYEFRVTAINNTGSGMVSSPLTIKTSLAAPLNFTSTVTSATAVALAWTANSDSTSYKVERSTAGAAFATLTPSPALTSASSSFTDTTAVAGTAYTYRLSAINTLGTSPANTATGVLTLPAVPVLTAVANSISQITLTWPVVQSATGYLLEDSADAGATWNTLTTANLLTFVHQNLVVDTAYKYRISAINNTGTGVTSTPITASTLLGAPTGFIANVNSATSVGLVWNQVTDATGIKIERSANGSTYTTVNTSAGTATSYTDTVAGGTGYYYRISAIDAAGTSLTTPAVQVLTVPVAPVLTTTLISATQINLAWNTSFGATSYRIDSSPDGSTWTPVISTTAVNFSNTSLTSDTTYHFRVVAIDATGQSAFSNSPTAITTYLLPPAGFSATPTAFNNMNLSWGAVTDAVTYKVERSPDGTTWTGLAGATALNQSTSTFADSTVLGGTQYYYRISAIDAVGPSAVSTTVTALTVPSTPTLTSTIKSATSIALNWNASTGAHTYKVETSLNNGSNWSIIATPSVLTYTVTGLSPDTQYEYRVSAVDATGPSVASAVQNLTTPLGTVASFIAVAGSATSVDLGWAVTTDATGFKIERSTDNVNWNTVSGSLALQGTDTSYIDTGLMAGTSYYYRISSNSIGGYSAPTTPGTHVLTDPSVPTQSGTVFSDSQINLTWSAVFSATSYEVQETYTQMNGSIGWQNVTPQPVGTATSLSITGLTPDTNYIYRVLAENASGFSTVPTVAINLTTTLAAPTTFVAASTNTSGTSLSWDAIGDATSYLLQRSTNGGAYTTVTPGTAWSNASAGYVDSGLSSGTTYSYKLFAIDAAGSSTASSVSILTTPAAPVLSGTATSATALNLTWAAVPSATSYTLQSYNGSAWSSVTPGPTGTATSYAITGLTADTTYTYQLFANNATGASAASNSLVKTTILPAPAISGITSNTSTSATITFTAAPDATSYVLQDSVDNTIFAPVTQTLGPTDTTVTVTGLAAGTHYYFRMAAVDASGTSLYATTNIVTVPTAPVLSGTVTSANVLNLTWNNVKSATSYTLQSYNGSAWSTVSPGPIGVVTNFSVTGLTADTAYQYQLLANNGTGASLASNSVTLTTDLAAPASFASNSSTATSVVLTWTAIPHATSYLLQRAPDGTTWSTITQTLGASDATFTDSTVAAGTTYTYRLAAIDASGNSAFATTTVLTLPAAPALNIDIISDTSLLLSWPAEQSATGYTVNIGNTSNGTTTWTAASTQPTGTATTLTITGLTGDTAYEYEVIATNATGNSVEGANATATTLLSAPSNFAANASSNTTVHLTWTAITDSTGYLLERSLNGVVWTTINPGPTGGSGTASFDDTTALGGTSYQYRLSAISASGTSAACTPVTVLTLPDAPVLSGLTASDSELDLSWTPVLSNTSYTLETSANGSGGWTTVSPAPGANTQIAITGLTSNTGYYYRVEANNASGESASSNVLSISTMADAPTNFAGTANSSSATLTWTAVSNASGYVIEQSIDGNNWITLNTNSLTGTSATFTDSTVAPGTAYQYRISTVNSLGTSDPGTPITVTTPLVAPTGLVAVVNSATQITLSWNQDTDNGLTGYRLEISTDGTSWSAVATPGSNATNTVVSGLTTATTYHFRLFALSAGGDSAADTAGVVTTS